MFAGIPRGIKKVWIEGIKTLEMSLMDDFNTENSQYHYDTRLTLYR